MSVNDWVGLFVGLATLFLLWQQNQIFRQQNTIFARQEGVSMTPSDRVGRLKRYWPIFAMASFTILTWAGTGYDIFDHNHGFDTGDPDQSATMAPMSERHLKIFNHLQAVEYNWRAYQYEPVSGQQFENTTVLLDGREFSNCTFTNVKFVYEGTAPWRFNGPQKFIGNNQVGSDSEVVKQTFNISFLIGVPAGGAIVGPEQPLPK